VRIGLAYNVRSASGHAATNGQAAADPFSAADDAEEEFDSPETIRALAEALGSLGHEVELLGDGEPALRALLDAAPADRPDLVFNLAEGRGVGRSREARIPAVLELLGIPHTGSDPLTLAVALDKDCAKRLVSAADVATAGWVLVEGDPQHAAAAIGRLAAPLIVKPAYEGSSKGILAASLVASTDEAIPLLRRMREAYRQPILVEEFIDGDELTVGLVGNAPPDVLGIMRVVPLEARGPFVYSLEIKRDWERRVRYECPARLAPRDAQAVREAALASWRALGCRDLARIDFRLRRGTPYFLEANPLPGLSPVYSDLILMARELGWEYRGLIGRIVEVACRRLGLALPAAAPSAAPP
jgi:D-alanine-D-alanine ligase